MDEAAVLGRLLSHYSPSGREAAAVAEFVRIARELGYRARTDAVGNGIAVRGTGRPHLLFLGHIDTVEGDRPVRHVRGRLHGRGAVDAKGPLACALVAGARFAGVGTLRVVAAVREETDSAGAVHLLRGVRPDAVVVGEPSSWDGITIAYKGDLRLEATFERPRAHWSAPVPTAADAAVEWVSRTRAAFTPHVVDSPYRSLLVKVAGVHADPAADPEVARVLVDIRIPPGMSTGEVLELLPRDPPPSATRLVARIEPFERPRTDPVVQALTSSVRTQGGAPTLYRKTGTSDLNVVAPAWGIPGAAYGPGDARMDHTDHESVAVKDLRKAGAVLERAFALLASDGRLTPRRSVAAP